MTTRLTERCRANFTAGDRQRGEDYFRQGRVRLESPSAATTSGATMAAEVRGSQRYHLAIDWSDAVGGELRTLCECPRFDEVGCCKHLWAMLLAIDAAGRSPIPGDGALALVDDFVDDLVGSGDESGGDWDQPPERRRPGAGSDEVVTMHAAVPIAGWRGHLGLLRRELAAGAPSSSLAHHAPSLGEVFYAIDLAATRSRGNLVLALYERRLKRGGSWGVPKRLGVDRGVLARIPPGEDHALVELLFELPSSGTFSYWHLAHRRVSEATLPGPLYDYLLPRLAATGRLVLAGAAGPNRLDLGTAVTWDPGPPWSFRLVAERLATGGLRLGGELWREGETRPLAEPLVLLASGLVIFPGLAARLDTSAPFAWISVLRSRGPLEVAAGEEGDAIAALTALPSLPPIAGDTDVLPRQERMPLRPCLTLQARPASAYPPGSGVTISFRYGAAAIAPQDPRGAIPEPATGRLLLRDVEAERSALATFARVPLASIPGPAGRWALAERHLARVVEELSVAGWEIEADGAPVRRGSALGFSVSSGIDWLDLEVDADFAGGGSASEDLLAALVRRRRFVRLDDGSLGMLPDEWLARFGSLARLASREEGGKLRFGRSQALLLDALLAGMPRVAFDAAFARLRDRLGAAEIVPVEEPPGFVGRLRDYQKLGVGWLRSLTESGFGGCLADDMGLGKTVQVLAHLQGRRVAAVVGEEPLPSLVVAPRSVVHNWLDEAARFAPALRVLDYSGLLRDELRARFAAHDLIVTTYGVVRRDALHLRAQWFDHLVFDEAQAIKNPGTQAHKACRLLQGRQRLVLSGTPVENHLGELWALLELLNPGLLGRLPPRRGESRGGELSDRELAAVGVAVRPFVLRRTKQQVLAELPPKTEQTLFCELGADQRRLYDRLKRHYQQQLGDRIAKVGIERSGIQVLEALLRLRQGACHPALVEPARAGERSAKLETLCAQLTELRQEGHKALVFSQFTRLLGLVRPWLEAQGIDYEYLDGRTRDRGAKVARFQGDPDCAVFLVSLKAGGVGLNLTAASYVFLLDPWWNPAVEAQAIDRAHRIGQHRPVFAYRLIARDTVEEKILDLQRSKRRVADAILAADAGALRGLTADDLRLLLS